MTYWEFLDSLPWWLMLLVGVLAGAVAIDCGRNGGRG